MTPRWTDSAAQLVASVVDGSSVMVGGTLFTRIPVAALRALAAAVPRNLHYISWGGGMPLEMLLAAGCVSHATLCFSSLDIFGPASRFRDAVQSGSLSITELNAHALSQGLSAGKRRLASEPARWPDGSDLTEADDYPVAYADPVSGERVAAAAAIRPDALLIHAQAADSAGNIEIWGARAIDLLAIAAAREVLVTVEEVKRRGSLGTEKGAVVIPRQFISAIAVVPGGALPTSCLPNYISDYGAISEWCASPDPLDVPKTSPINPLRQGKPITTAMITNAVAQVVAAGPADTSEATVDEWMVCWLSRQYDNDSICSVGAVSPLAASSYLLAKASHAPELTLLTNGGCYIDVDVRPVLLGLGEWLDAITALTHWGGEESYEWYYQAGLISYEVVSVAQIDAQGRTNNVSVVTPSGRTVRLPGQGGMADVADMHQNFVVYLPRQSPLNTPESVAFTSSARTLHSDDERLAAGYQPGHVRLVTNLAVFERIDGRFRVCERFPWTTWQNLREATGFALDVDEAEFNILPLVEAPTAETLALLRNRVDPLGIRKLEFVSSRDRSPALLKVIQAERAVIRFARTYGDTGQGSR